MVFVLHFSISNVVTIEGQGRLRAGVYTFFNLMQLIQDSNYYETTNTFVCDYPTVPAEI